MMNFRDWYHPKIRLERWWECYVGGTNGGKHYHHWTLENAKKEAERLARLTSKTVYLFECIGKCKAEEQPVKWDLPR